MAAKTSNSSIAENSKTHRRNIRKIGENGSKQRNGMAKAEEKAAKAAAWRK